MPTIAIPRSDVTSEEVSEALRRGLGPRYKVLTDTAANWNPVGNLRPDHPDRIVIGTGSARVFRAQVTISEHSGQTLLHVIPGGISLPLRLLNRLWISQKVQNVLQAAPGLR
jgi:hypothetical protein